MKTKGVDQAELDQGPRQCNAPRYVVIFAAVPEGPATSVFVVQLRLGGWARVGQVSPVVLVLVLVLGPVILVVLVAVVFGGLVDVLVGGGDLLRRHREPGQRRRGAGE